LLSGTSTIGEALATPDGASQSPGHKIRNAMRPCSAAAGTANDTAATANGYARMTDDRHTQSREKKDPNDG
jgi:hypothetical protein